MLVDFLMVAFSMCVLMLLIKTNQILYMYAYVHKKRARIFFKLFYIIIVQLEFIESACVVLSFFFLFINNPMKLMHVTSIKLI